MINISLKNNVFNGIILIIYFIAYKNALINIMRHEAESAA